MMAATSCDPECVQDHRTAVYLTLATKRDNPWNPAHHPTTVSYAVFPAADPAEASDFEGTFGLVPRLRPARCLDDDANCHEYALGFDEAGTYEIDVEVCGKKFETTVEVPLSADMCHAEPQEVEIVIDSSGCLTHAVPHELAPNRLPEPDPNPGGQMDPDPDRPVECDGMAHPSVYAVVGNTVGDVFMPVDVDQVWYTVTPRDDHPRERIEEDDDAKPLAATCIENPNGGPCVAWIAGFEQSGTFTLSTQYCEVEVEETVWVDKPEDACHVSTEFVMLEVETRGCLGARTPDGGGPHPDPEQGPRLQHG